MSLERPSEQERIETAQWILERNLAWIAASDIKGGFLVIVNSSMLGWLASAFSGSHEVARTNSAYGWTIIAIGGSIVALGCAVAVYFPRLNGPRTSLIFSAPISAMPVTEYLSKLITTTNYAVLEDLASQIHTNAQISVQKFTWVKRGISATALALIPWLRAVWLLVQK